MKTLSEGCLLFGNFLWASRESYNYLLYNTFMLSLIFPVYNEEKRLTQSLKRIKAYFSKVNYPYELLFVNDGSTDGSVASILSERSESKDFLLLSHPRNLGKGAAIRTGVMAAKGDWVLFCDLDLSVSLKTIDIFLQNQTTDLVIASRRVKGARILTHQNRFREFMGCRFTQLSNLILGINHSDFTCGFKMLKTPVAKELFSLQKLNSWTFDAEILFLAKKLGYKVKELPVDWSDVKGSKVKFPKDLIQSFIDLLKIRYYNLKGCYSAM